MSIKVGDLAPEISGTDLSNAGTWSLKGQAPATVFLALAPLTGPAVDDIANGLVGVWNTLDGNTEQPFSMALITGYVPGTQPPAEETAAATKAAIEKYNINFSVIHAAGSWKTYLIPDVENPAWYCLHWEEASGAYRVHKLTTSVPQGGAVVLKNHLLTMLQGCGVKIGQPQGRPVRPLDHTVLPQILWFLGSPTTDGGGVGIRPGGHPIPIPPGDPLHVLGPAGRDAIIGLYVAALGAQLSDAELGDKVKRSGISAAKSALGKL